MKQHIRPAEAFRLDVQIVDQPCLADDKREHNIRDLLTRTTAQTLPNQRFLHSNTVASGFAYLCLRRNVVCS